MKKRDEKKVDEKDIKCRKGYIPRIKKGGTRSTEAEGDNVKQQRSKKGEERDGKNVKPLDGKRRGLTEHI